MNRLSSSIIILIFLIATTTGMAHTDISVGILTKKKAKEKYGITMHARKNGDDGIKVWLEFKKRRVAGKIHLCRTQDEGF